MFDAPPDWQTYAGILGVMLLVWLLLLPEAMIWEPKKKAQAREKLNLGHIARKTGSDMARLHGIFSFSLMAAFLYGYLFMATPENETVLLIAGCVCFISGVIGYAFVGKGREFANYQDRIHYLKLAPLVVVTVGGMFLIHYTLHAYFGA